MELLIRCGQNIVQYYEYLYMYYTIENKHLIWGHQLEGKKTC